MSTEERLAAVAALAEKWHREANEAKKHGVLNPRMSKRHAARLVARALADK